MRSIHSIKKPILAVLSLSNFLFNESVTIDRLVDANFLDVSFFFDIAFYKMEVIEIVTGLKFMP